MGEVSFLNDDGCRAAIVRLTAEAAKVWAPEEADLVDVVADEYFHQVQAAGRILYPGRTYVRPLGFGGPELTTVTILAVATGLMGNLLSEAAVEGFKALKSRRSRQQQPRGTETPSSLLQPDRIRTFIEPGARAGGFSPKQVEQLAQLFADVIPELLTGNDQWTTKNAGSVC